MNRYEMYSKRLMWSGAFLLTAVMAGCGGGGDGGGGGGGSPAPQAGPAHYDFGAAASFGAGSGGGVVNQGTATMVTGDLGTSNPSSTIKGLKDSTGATYSVTAANAGSVSGIIYTGDTPPGDNHAHADAVVAALTKAYADLGPITATGGTEPNSTTPGELGGLTLAPGVYLSANLQITGGDLTLDAKGDPNAFWILQSGNNLTVGDPATPRNVVLANGALAKNVYWWVGSSATINAAGGGTMQGTIISSSGLNISSTAGSATNTTLNGRAFIFGGAAINMFNTIINTPAP
jgi:hypothetical protein